MILHINNIPDEEIKIYLEKNYQTKINSKIMLDAFQGSIGKALQLRDKQEEYEKIEQIIYSLENKDKIDILKMSEPIYKAKDKNCRCSIFSRLASITWTMMSRRVRPHTSCWKELHKCNLRCLSVC